LLYKIFKNQRLPPQLQRDALFKLFKYKIIKIKTNKEIKNINKKNFKFIKFIKSTLVDKTLVLLKNPWPPIYSTQPWSTNFNAAPPIFIKGINSTLVKKGRNHIEPV